ncbi:MAG TPA: hypothetical protein VK395_30405 [Gemmataceae bacterium]|nr:hypothetical protein [Gemmataceae bacterium]
MSKSDLDNAFPNLALSNYEISSPKSRRYNCIAWACKDTTRKWDCFAFPVPPGYHWPKGASLGDDIVALISVFAAQGYAPCAESSLEDGYEKVALYVDDAGEWTHAARQLPNGKWTSKMGDAEDITHSAPEDLTNSIYGEAHCYMKRPSMKRQNEEEERDKL